MTGLVVDLFAGGGGASTGIEAALGRSVDIAINHSPTALAVHAANHPGTRHLTADIWEVRPTDATRGRPVDMLWASPDCTHFSVARGGKPREHGIRSLAWAVVDWAREVRPRVIFLENVGEFRTWGPLHPAGTIDPGTGIDIEGSPIKERMGETFALWRGALELLGYAVDYQVLDASRYGAPTKRRRLVLVARCDGQPVRWPSPTHGPGLLPFHTAAECIDWSLPCPSIFERKKPLAEKTLWRIAQGIRRFVLETDPFIVQVNHGRYEDRSAVVAPTLIQTGYGERPGRRPRYLDLHQPLGAVMAQGQKHAMVSAFLAKHFGGVVGTDLRTPVSTVTARDHHAVAVAAATLVEPMPTLTALGFHVAEVRAFLTAFYGSDGSPGCGQDLRKPARTITAKARLGIVTVGDVEHQIVDIGLRMMAPHELLRAQFGRFAATYDLSAARTKSAQVRLIGNSVCPEMAEAVVTANLEQDARRVA